MSYLTNEDLDEAMPFLVNYDKLKNIFHDISEDLVIVLDFVKSSLELNVKLNIMNSLYENNCNKNTKIENIDKSINNLNNLYQNGKMILLQINKDYKNYKELNGSKEEQIKNGYLIMEKYALFERYSVEKERPTTIEDVSAIKFIIKLNKKYRNKEKFLFHLFLSLNNFNKGKRKLDENKFISDIKNSNNKKIKKNKNFEKKYELNSIKEENYSSSLNTQNNIYNYDDEYYKNYCGDNKISKIKYIIKLNKKYRNKEKFILQLSSSLISYTKGIRKINKEKFIKNIKENRNNSLNKKSNTNSFNKNTNKNLLMHSIESNNSSINLYKSFMTNSILNVTRNNSTPYRSEKSRNNILFKKSFVDSYPTFDNFYQLSNRNLLLKDGLNVSSVDLEQTKNNMNYREFNSMKNSKNRNNNTICFRNLKQQQINLKFENEQWTPCSFCCKTIKNIYNK
jgi:hypothetical protein